MSAVTLVILLIVYTVFLILLMFAGPSRWVNVTEYIAFSKQTWHLYLTLCQLMAFLCAPVYLILISSIHDYANNQQKSLTRISLCFATVFVTLSSIIYFVQFSAVRQSIQKGQLEGLEQFIQLNTSSPMYAMAMLGWTLFLGLSSLFVVPVFSGEKIQKWVKYSFLANGLFCCMGFIGYVIDSMMLNLLYVLGMGVSMIIIAISLSILFKKNHLAT